MSAPPGVDEPTWPRLLPIPGSHNLRDMGGYVAADGRRVKWRHLYRSGEIARPTAADTEQLAALGIRAICDLRDSQERERWPMLWHQGLPIAYWSRDYTLSIGSLQTLAERESFSPEETLAAIREVYRLLPYEQAESYREVFRRLAAGEVPLLFNCSAGKDRTGIAAALILTALDVPRETIRDDYRMTDDVLDGLIAIFLNSSKYARLAALPRELYLPLLRSDSAYLDLMFEEIETRHGSVARYLNEILGVGEREIAAMRDHLLEPAPASRRKDDGTASRRH